MPRSRGSEMSSQRQSPRVPLHLKTTAASEANSLHRPKPADDHRSPRSGPLHEKKRVSTRVADLETKLSQAQEEIKKLQQHLASVEAAKKETQQEQNNAKNQIPTNPVRPEPEPATDVFEVVTLALSPSEPQEEEVVVIGNDDEQKLSEEELIKTESVEISDLRAKLADRELENENLKKREQEIGERLRCMVEEVGERKGEVERLKEKVEAAEKARGEVEAEMKRVKVQTEQWRKAAEAAAEVIADEEGGGRCGTIDKQFTWSPIAAGGEVEEGGGKRKGSGIRVFGDLWKKKGQHKG